MTTTKAARDLAGALAYVEHLYRVTNGIYEMLTEARDRVIAVEQLVRSERLDGRTTEEEFRLMAEHVTVYSEGEVDAAAVERQLATFVAELRRLNANDELRFAEVAARELHVLLERARDQLLDQLDDHLVDVDDLVSERRPG